MTTELDIWNVEDYEHKVWFDYHTFEETKFQKIDMHTNFVVIPELGLKAYAVFVDYRDSIEDEWETNFSALMFFNMKTNELVYEENSALSVCLHNYNVGRGLQSDYPDSLENLKVLIRDGRTNQLYSHVTDTGELQAITSPPEGLLLESPTGIIDSTFE